MLGLAGIPTLSGSLFVYSYDSFNKVLSSPNYMMWNDKATNDCQSEKLQHVRFVMSDRYSAYLQECSEEKQENSQLVEPGIGFEHWTRQLLN